jgi:hypothetical protein
VHERLGAPGYDFAKFFHSVAIDVLVAEHLAHLGQHGHDVLFEFFFGLGAVRHIQQNVDD